MKKHLTSRRRFLRTTGTAAGAGLLTSALPLGLRANLASLPGATFQPQSEVGSPTYTLRIAASAPAGPRTLTVNASYQSCNNKICLPPKTVKVEVPVTVSK